jgi:transcriptional regulator with XRE-family HTH domain
MSMNGAVAAEVVASLSISGLTRTELAERTNMHTSTISRLLKNQRPINVDVLHQFAVVLGFDISDLMRRAEHRLEQSRTYIRGEQ